jgi:hypothetical protein
VLSIGLCASRHPRHFGIAEQQVRAAGALSLTQKPSFPHLEGSTIPVGIIIPLANALIPGGPGHAHSHCACRQREYSKSKEKIAQNDITPNTVAGTGIPVGQVGMYMSTPQHCYTLHINGPPQHEWVMQQLIDAISILLCKKRFELFCTGQCGVARSANVNRREHDSDSVWEAGADKPRGPCRADPAGMLLTSAYNL